MEKTELARKSHGIARDNESARTNAEGQSVEEGPTPPVDAVGRRQRMGNERELGKDSVLLDLKGIPSFQRRMLLLGGTAIAIVAAIMLIWTKQFAFRGPSEPPSQAVAEESQSRPTAVAPEIVQPSAVVPSTSAPKSTTTDQRERAEGDQLIQLSQPLSLERERKLQPKETFKECPNCPEMVVVPAGSFTMGSSQNEQGRSSDEGPQHQVTIMSPFAVGKFEVTFAEWEACAADGSCLRKKTPSDNGWGAGTDR